MDNNVGTLLQILGSVLSRFSPLIRQITISWLLRVSSGKEHNTSLSLSLFLFFVVCKSSAKTWLSYLTCTFVRTVPLCNSPWTNIHWQLVDGLPRPATKRHESLQDSQDLACSCRSNLLAILFTRVWLSFEEANVFFFLKKEKLRLAFERKKVHWTLFYESVLRK